MSNKRKVIFLDRDGVINKEVGYLHKIADVEFIAGVFDACRYFQALGFELIIITNQSGIARGYYSQADFQNLSKWMVGQFNAKNIDILDIFFCPHGVDSTCECRKPRPGMLFVARDRHNVDMNNSWMIGDKQTDIEAANAAGVCNTILVQSGHNINEATPHAKFILKSIQDSVEIIKQVSKQNANNI